VNAACVEWTPASSLEPLARGSIHVWLGNADRLSGEGGLRTLLTLDEQTRAARFAFARDRDRFVAARAFLRCLLGYYLETDASAIRLGYQRYGKPFLTEKHADCGIDFNLSHSDGIVTVAISRAGAVGVDVEAIRPIDDRDILARRVLAAGEWERLQAVPHQARDEAFLTAWTRKEAFVKAIGEGLSHPLDQFEVTLAPGEPARVLRIAGDAAVAAEWTVASLPPMARFIGALTVRGPAAVRWYRWNEDGLAPGPGRLRER
jgi:4'-phosphopantetheinyl transferase